MIFNSCVYSSTKKTHATARHSKNHKRLTLIWNVSLEKFGGGPLLAIILIWTCIPPP